MPSQCCYRVSEWYFTSFQHIVRLYQDSNLRKDDSPFRHTLARCETTLVSDLKFRGQRR